MIKRSSIPTTALLIVFLLGGKMVWASNSDDCLLEQFKQAQGATTVAELRAYCDQHTNKATAAENTITETVIDSESMFDNNAEVSVDQLLKSEDLAETSSFTLTAYKPNYLLYATYNSKADNEHYANIYPDGAMDKVEAKLQLSFKTRLAKGVLGADLWAAYTQQSWWQLYNSDLSKPFRETNYEPELFFRWNPDYKLLGFNNRFITFGFNHESNGRSEPLSRSWNRLVAGATLEKGNLLLTGRVWYRLPENKNDDDNPDMLKYMGYGDINAIYKTRSQSFSVTLTNNLRRENKGAVELGWAFPMGSRIKGYLQYYNGYGESLIDYDNSVNRISIGMLLNDWL